MPASVRPAEVSENFVPPTSAPTTSREVAWLISPEVFSALVAVAVTRPRVTGPAARTLARKAASETTPSAVRFTEAVEPTRLAPEPCPSPRPAVAAAWAPWSLLTACSWNGPPPIVCSGRAG